MRRVTQSMTFPFVLVVANIPPSDATMTWYVNCTMTFFVTYVVTFAFAIWIVSHGFSQQQAA